MEEPVILNKVTDELRNKLYKSFSITIFVGAGVSVSSGIATFRGIGREKYFQKKYNPTYLCSVKGFSQYPKIAWEYFKHTYELVKIASPNIAHNTLASWQKEVAWRGKHLCLLTTNYDGLIKEAGGQAEELYGNINEVGCSSCQKSYLMSEINLNVLPPMCECGNILMPSIALLGSLIKEEHYERACTATRGCSVYIAVGTSGVDSHSYGLMKSVKIRPNTTLIEINPRPSHLTKDMNYVLVGSAEEILPQFE